ncbi:MAG: NAD(P)H-dependent oxidoreductase [Lachnoclostridium sp.]
MKITIIHGQNHKGSSYHIGRMLAEKLADEQEITEFFLPKALNHFCLGCYSCIDDEKRCPYYSEKKVIADAMEQAELLIFTTPTYCMECSAPMKSFMDFFYQYWIPHRPRNICLAKKQLLYPLQQALVPAKRLRQSKGLWHIGCSLQKRIWYGRKRGELGAGFGEKEIEN